MQDSRIKVTLNNRVYIPVSEALILYGCSKENIHWLVKFQGLNAEKIGRQTFVDKEQLLELNEHNKLTNRKRISLRSCDSIAVTNLSTDRL